MIKQFILVVSLSVAYGLLDDASLLQNFKQRTSLTVLSANDAPKETRRAYFGNLLESVEGMLKAGVTPEVVAFAQEAIHSIQNTIFPTIFREHQTDQDMLNALFALIETVHDEFHAGIAEIRGHLETRQESGVSHTSCREQESDLCLRNTACEAELANLWRDVVDNETIISEIDIGIYHHWCEDENNRTLIGFRTESVERFELYVSRHPLLLEAWELYLAKLSECQALYKQMVAKNEVCDELQEGLEQISCQHAVKSDHVGVTYYESYLTSTQAYNDARAGIEIEAADRRVEYGTLHTVVCLLENIANPVNGSAAEAGTDYLSVIAECRNSWTDDELIIDFHTIPPRQTAPEIPTYPCQLEYLEEEYGSLPTCIDLADCQTCTQLPQTTPPPTSQPGTCVDLIDGWKDNQGDSCQNYQDFGYCRHDGEYGMFWLSQWGFFELYQTQGHSAATACCACGGGSEPNTCQNMVEGWIDSDGYSCHNYRTNQLCDENGGFGVGWDPSWGDHSQYAVNGRAATDVCCACGGGGVVQPSLPCSDVECPQGHYAARNLETASCVCHTLAANVITANPLNCVHDTFVSLHEFSFLVEPTQQQCAFAVSDVGYRFMGFGGGRCVGYAQPPPCTESIASFRLVVSRPNLLPTVPVNTNYDNDFPTICSPTLADTGTIVNNLVDCTFTARERGARYVTFNHLTGYCLDLQECESPIIVGGSEDCPQGEFESEFSCRGYRTYQVASHGGVVNGGCWIADGVTVCS